MPEILRLLTSADIPAAAALSTEAGWNQTQRDWQVLLEISPDGCYGIELDGKLAATTTLVCYDSALGWIGMVLTTRSHRGRGYAQRLLRHVLAQADERSLPSVKLDATDQGQPIYEKLGFRMEQPVERWQKPGDRTTQQLPARPLSTPHWQLDLEAMNVDRSPLLNRLATANPPDRVESSYLLSRPGRCAAYLGPCMCENSRHARELIEEAVRKYAGDLYWDLLPANTDATALARELGLTPQRRLVRMVRGKNFRGNEASIYAIAGFELG